MLTASDILTGRDLTDTECREFVGNCKYTEFDEVCFYNNPSFARYCIRHEHYSRILPADRAWRIAASNNFTRVLPVLNEHWAMCSMDIAMRNAVVHDSLDFIKQLRAMQYKPDADMELVAECGSLETFKYLHGKCDKLTIQWLDTNFSALHNGRHEILEYLERKGHLIIHLDVRNINYATRRNQVGMVKYLVDYLTRKDRATFNHDTLTAAVISGNPDLVEYFIQMGAKADYETFWHAGKGNDACFETLSKYYKPSIDYSPNTLAEAGRLDML